MILSYIPTQTGKGAAIGLGIGTVGGVVAAPFICGGIGLQGIAINAFTHQLNSNWGQIKKDVTQCLYEAPLSAMVGFSAIGGVFGLACDVYNVATAVFTKLKLA